MSKKFEYHQKVRVVKGSWKNEVGIVTGYERGHYVIRFSGRGRITTFVDFKSTELKAA